MGSVLSATNSFQPWTSLRCVTENSDSPFCKSTWGETAKHKLIDGPAQTNEPKSQNSYFGSQLLP